MPSYDLSSPPPLPSVNIQEDNLLTGEGEGDGEEPIQPRRESLVLYKSYSQVLGMFSQKWRHHKIAFFYQHGGKKTIAVPLLGCGLQPVHTYSIPSNRMVAGTGR